MLQVEKVFTLEKLDFKWTSLCRPDPDTLHGYGLAADGDVTIEISPETGKVLASRVQRILGSDFYVTWHKSPKWHLHVEYDPGNKGVAPYREEFEKLWAA
jgi:hypothetical protein